jgi:hypothetical protein
LNGCTSCTVEAIARNDWLDTTSTGIQTVQFYWEPVADGVGIFATAEGPLLEDANFTMNVKWGSLDIDGSEEVGEWAFIQLDENAQLIGYEKVEGPFTFQNYTLSGYYMVRSSDLNALQIQPRLNWHGVISGSIFMNGTETLAPYPIKMSKGSFSFKVSAVADSPLLTAPMETITVLENEKVVLTGLSAALFDNVKENGAEYLSIVFEGVPEDSFFLQNGVKVGDPSAGGRWFSDYAFPVVISLYLTFCFCS